jgi:hypothetical protein
MNIVDVLWIISERDNLVNGSSHGIYPFSEYRKHDDRVAIYYDDTNPTYGEDGIAHYPVVRICFDDGVHHDIMSVYGTVVEDYTVTVFAAKFKDKFEIMMAIETDEDGVFGRNSVIYCISDGQYHAYFYRILDGECCFDQ